MAHRLHASAMAFSGFPVAQASHLADQLVLASCGTSPIQSLVVMASRSPVKPLHAATCKTYGLS